MLILFLDFGIRRRGREHKEPMLASWAFRQHAITDGVLNPQLRELLRRSFHRLVAKQQEEYFREEADLEEKRRFQQTPGRLLEHQGYVLFACELRKRQPAAPPAQLVCDYLFGPKPPSTPLLALASAPIAVMPVRGVYPYSASNVLDLYSATAWFDFPTREGGDLYRVEFLARHCHSDPAHFHGCPILTEEAFLILMLAGLQSDDSRRFVEKCTALGYTAVDDFFFRQRKSRTHPPAEEKTVAEAELPLILFQELRRAVKKEVIDALSESQLSLQREYDRLKKLSSSTSTTTLKPCARLMKKLTKKKCTHKLVRSFFGAIIGAIIGACVGLFLNKIASESDAPEREF